MHPENALKALGWWLLYLFAAIAVVIAVPALSSASTGKSHQNSLGAVIDEVNPYIYNVGMPKQIVTFQCGTFAVCTNVIFAPYGTDLMNSESITFCGNEESTFQKGTQVLMYRRVATKYYQGIGCHDLTKILTVEEPHESFQ